MGFPEGYLSLVSCVTWHKGLFRKEFQFAEFDLQ